MEILGWGKAIPQTKITNDDLSQIVDTDDEWITSRTGIKTRFFVKDEKNSDLATNAAREALYKNQIPLEKIAFCIVATFTPDTHTPSVACMVSKNLGLNENTICFDLNAACTGFIYAMYTANIMINSLSDNMYGVIIGSEVISRYLDMADRNTCILFGDGAGALVVKKNNLKNYNFVLGNKPNDTALKCEVEKRQLKMCGKDVFCFAVEYGANTIKRLLAENNVTIDEIDYIVCHQANIRIIDSLAKRLCIKREKFYTNLEKYGNTSAASIPIALCEMFENNLLKNKRKIICVGFGGGLTYGGILLTV